MANGANADSAAPVLVPGLTGITAVSIGAEFGLALKNDGTLWSWGFNNCGSLGDGNDSEDANVPMQVVGLTTVTAVAAAWDEHGLAITNDGTAWSWGLNINGQLGVGGSFETAPSCSSVPLQVL